MIQNWTVTVLSVPPRDSYLAFSKKLFVKSEDAAINFFLFKLSPDVTDWYQDQDVDDVKGSQWIQLKACSGRRVGLSPSRLTSSSLTLSSLVHSPSLHSSLTLRVSVLVLFNSVCGYLINSCSFHFLHAVCSLFSTGYCLCLLEAFGVLFPCFSNIHHSVHRVLFRVVLVLFAACYVSVPVMYQSTGSVTFLFFHSGNLLGFVYFAASTCIFVGFFFNLLISSSPVSLLKSQKIIFLCIYFLLFSIWFVCMSCGNMWSFGKTFVNEVFCPHQTVVDKRPPSFPQWNCGRVETESQGKNTNSIKINPSKDIDDAENRRIARLEILMPVFYSLVKLVSVPIQFSTIQAIQNNWMQMFPFSIPNANLLFCQNLKVSLVTVPAPHKSAQI